VNAQLVHRKMLMDLRLDHVMHTSRIIPVQIMGLFISRLWNQYACTH